MRKFKSSLFWYGFRTPIKVLFSERFSKIGFGGKLNCNKIWEFCNTSLELSLISTP